MRISDSPSPDSAAAVQPAASPAAKDAEQPNAPGAAATDQASVGAVALAASQILEASEPKIAALRQQYLDGTYRVDPNELSSRIVDEHLQK